MRVTVGMGSCGIAAGAQKTWNVLEHCFKEQGISLSVEQVGCIGMCFNEPIVEVITDTDHFYYGKVNGEMAAEIVEKHIKGGGILDSRRGNGIPNKTDSGRLAELWYH